MSLCLFYLYLQGNAFNIYVIRYYIASLIRHRTINFLRTPTQTAVVPGSRSCWSGHANALTSNNSDSCKPS